MNRVQFRQGMSLHNFMRDFDTEAQFNWQWEAIYRYASQIDDAAGVGGTRDLDDFLMVVNWQENADRFPRLPKFRVRTDVEGLSGRKPPRTGVYVSQDAPNATLQFAWTGNDDGVLGNAIVFNDVGQRLLAAVGRDAPWIDDTKLIPIAIQEMERNPNLDTGMNGLARVRAKPSRARNAMAFAAFTKRPCRWYFVEPINGEFDDEAEAKAAPSPVSPARLRCEANQPCPKAGYWFTPARAGSRQRFEAGQVMPEVGGDYGATLWQWDDVQG